MFRTKFQASGALLVATLLASGCSSTSSDCKANSDCASGQTCDNGKCVTGSAGGGAGGGSGTGGGNANCGTATTCSTCADMTGCGWCGTKSSCEAGDENGPSEGTCPTLRWNHVASQCPGVCAAPTKACTQNTDCCQVDPGIGDEGAICFNNTCASICHVASDCSTGCCSPVPGQSYGACAPATACETAYGPCNGDVSCEAGEKCTALAAGTNRSCSKACTQDADCPTPSTGFPTCGTTIPTLNLCYVKCDPAKQCPDSLKCYDTSNGEFICLP